MNVFIERVFSIIKELLLAIMINDKINDTDQKMLWAESVRTCTRVRNSMANTGSTTSPFKKYMEKKQRSLVCSWSSDVLDTSINGTSSRSK